MWVEDLISIGGEGGSGVSGYGMIKLIKEKDITRLFLCIIKFTTDDSFDEYKRRTNTHNTYIP